LGAGRDLFAAGKKAGAQFIRRQLTIVSYHEAQRQI
jgi:hypothetical protein